MVSPRLYLRGNRTTVITAHVSMETMGSVHTTADYSEGSTRFGYSPDEEYARHILKRSGLDFETVDLSKSVWARLLARWRGITQTPTLIDGSESERRFVGVNEIQKFLAGKRGPS